VQEDARDLDGLVEQAAGIVAEIEDDAGGRCAQVPPRLRQCLDELLVGFLIEARNPEDRDPAIELHDHGRQHDVGAADRERNGLRHARALDADDDTRSRGSPEAHHDLIPGQG